MIEQFFDTVIVASSDERVVTMTNQNLSAGNHGLKSKASLRLRLFCMMKYMHQYKQKRRKYFGFVAKKNSFFCPLFKPLKITL